MVHIGRFAELEDVLVERVVELRGGHPLAPLTIVVGSAAVRTRVSDLLVRRLEAVANVSVVTLSRLATDIVAHAQPAPPVVLAGLARERLLRRLVADRGANALAYFGRVAERPHFAKALAATFADLREARVSPQGGWAAAAVAAGAANGPAKAADLEALYEAYCDSLRRRALLDGADVYRVAADAVLADADAVPDDAPTILYGVYDLNQAQEAFVTALLTRGAELLVPIPRGGDGAGATALAAARAAGLGEAWREPSAPDDDLARVAAVWRPTRSAPARAPEFSGDGTLRIVSVADERGETREAVRAVLGAMRAGAALWDCAVVAPNGDEVERLAAGLEAAGLPPACRRPDRSVGPRVVARLADCLAPSAGEPFPRRAVIDLLGAAPLRASSAGTRETAAWLDEARQAGVVSGLDQWIERVGRRRRGLERRVAELEARGQDPAGDDDEAVEKLELVRARLAAAEGLDDAVSAVAGACAALPSRGRWRAWVAGLSAVVEALFADPEAAAAGDVVARLAGFDVLGEEVDLAEVTSALREQLADTTVPVGRVGRDGVAVLTPLELRGLRFHTVVIAGLAEGGFPARGRPDPILGDAERRRLGEVLGARLPLAESRDAESTLLFAFACEAAREQLTLLSPRTDATTGRPRLPSRFLLRLASLAAGRPVGLDEFLSGAPLAAVWRRVGGLPAYADDASVVWADARERDTAALLSLSGRGRRAAASEYLAEVLADPNATARRLDGWQVARSPEPGAWDGLLGGEARAALAARHPFAAEMHSTRLERYVTCPFAFLLRDVIGLDAPDEPGAGLDMDAREFGTLVHDILQRAYEAVIDGDLGLDGALVVVVRAWETGCAEAERRGVTGSALAWDVRRAILRDDLLEAVRRDPVFERRDGRPLAVEWRFGESVARPVALELADGRRVRFAGRLDRIDETSAGARIVDYKTGKGGTERLRLRDGLSVQLPVYQLAVRQAGEQAYRQVACLYRLVTRRGGFAELPLPEDEAAAGARLRALVAEVIALVDAGLFVRSTGGRCEYCDVGYACGVTAWARDRMREHESLRALVSLQTGGPMEGGDDAGA